jgi:peptidoglycan/LPS O-acetylase OafA/YrhL
VASFAFLAALIQSDAAQRFFSNRFFLFIGRISYGIYLMHWTLVTATFNYWDQLVLLFPDKKTAFVTLCLLVYLMTLMLATLLHYCVELPFMRLGRKWTQHLKPSLVV